MVSFREIIPKWPKNSGMAGGQEKWCGQKKPVSEICFFLFSLPRFMVDELWLYHDV